MRLFKLLIILLTVSALTNCSKDETPAPTPDAEEQPKPDSKPEEPKEPVDEIYFSYYDDPNEFYADWTESWMIIHNQDGELLDYRSFKQGDSLVFIESTEKLKTTNTLTITTLKYRPKNEGGDFQIMATEMDINKGSVWGWSDDFGTTIPNPPATNSYPIKITVNDVPNIQHYGLTSQFEGFVVGDAFYREIDTLEIYQSLQIDRTYLLSIRDGNDDFKYQWVELPDPLGDITFEYNEFSDYDHILEVDLPEHEGYVARVNARKKSENYGSSLIISNDGSGRQMRSTAKLGYIDSFDTFFTDFHLSYDDHSKYNFYNVQTRPNKIEIPVGHQFQVENTSIFDFSFTTDVEYYRNVSSWIYENLEQNNTTFYSISGKSEGASLNGTFPEEILDKFPALNLENLKYEETRLIFGENIDFKSDDRITIGGLFVPSGYESLTFKNPEE